MKTSTPIRLHRWRRRALALAAASAATLGLLAAAPAPAGAETPAGTGTSASDWTSAGQNDHDTHFAASERAIGPDNVSGLQPKWTFTSGGSISATPTVVGGTVYVPDWDGNLYSVNASTGQAVWTRKISSYTGVDGDMSRNSPAYWKGELVLGDGGLESSTTAGAYLYGVDAATGAKLWSTQVDANPAAIITGSPVVHDGVVLVGISSKSEAFPGAPTFRGSMVALDAVTGKILWQTYMVPQGYTGAAIWASTPVVDDDNGTVITGTGNNYTTPPGICTSPDDVDCTQAPPSNMQDAIVALDLRTGAVRWSTLTLTADTWTGAEQFGPDFDFGAGPNLFTATVDGKQEDLLGIGQKSGVYWALDPDTGAIVWKTPVGPGGEGGGLEWGTAVDGDRIYVADTNSDGVETTLTSATGEKTTTTGGFWAALDPSTGRILWETAVPPNSQVADPYSQVTVANGVLYAGSLNSAGKNMYALDAKTGTVKWSFASGGSVVGGAAVADGTVYMGSGYPTTALGFPFNGDNNKLYAFAPVADTAPSRVFVSPTGKAGASGTSCGTAAFSSVNAAIRAVAAKGSVTVCAGTYQEDIAVTRQVSLGVSGNVVIDATGWVNGIHVLASGADVSGFTVRNATAEGILVDHADNVTIQTDIVEDNDRGAGPDAVESGVGRCLDAQQSCGGGIHLIGASNATIQSNTVRADAAGIVISDETGPSTGNLVRGNSVLDNAQGPGIVLAGRNAQGAPGSTPAPASGGVYTNTVSTNTIVDNGLTAGGGGITLESSLTGGAVYRNTLDGNIISGNGGSGVTVHSLASEQDFAGNIVQNNHIGVNNTVGDTRAGGVDDRNTTGVLISAVEPLQATLSGNSISGDQVGIWLGGKATAPGAATGNSFSGVAVAVSVN